MAKTGRPSGYRPEYPRLVYQHCLLGATEQQVADLLEVSTSTITTWKQEHPEFLAALKAGKDKADALVAQSLYRRATGYSHAAVKIFMPTGADEPVYARYREHYPPDVTACIFWLKNRQRANWRDRTDHEHNMPKDLLDALKTLDGGSRDLPPPVEEGKAKYDA